MIDPSYIAAAKAAQKLLALRQENPERFHQILPISDADIDTLREIATWDMEPNQGKMGPDGTGG